MHCICFVAQSCLTLCDPVDYGLPDSFVLEILGENTGVGCYAFLQGIFPTQGSNPGLPHCRCSLYCLSHQGSLCVCTHIFCYFYLFAHIKSLVFFVLQLPCLSWGKMGSGKCGVCLFGKPREMCLYSCNIELLELNESSAF